MSLYQSNRVPGKRRRTQIQGPPPSEGLGEELQQQDQCNVKQEYWIGPGPGPGP